ncbi:glycosyltransferase family 25, putative [Bodo saltans]|uniref:Glycosyltransferase family 25, putative n=1 Tax=Bodo saltans TaxID=75058 RepID=A0A0S4J607_BODSA|nr:glycosyltransferase family 25, putative [Bodo saltans]|eukprot:CUG84181.1 glycosyltransferase family 25, putative [Bodo saltans]
MASRSRATIVLGFAMTCFVGLLFLALHGGSDESVVPVLSTQPTLASRPLREIAQRVTSAPDTTVVNVLEQGTTSTTLEDADILPCARMYFEANYQQSLLTTPSAERDGAVIAEAGIDKIYMIHYTPMKKRREAMSSMLAKHNVFPQWVTGFDKEVLNETTAQCFHTWRPEEYRGKKKAERSMLGKKALGKSQRSVVTKHHSALYDMYRMGYKHALVLEDDALLRTNFRRRLAEVMAEVPSSYDVIMIGGCMKMFAYRRKFNTTQLSKHVYRKREARCAHAFVVSQKGARRLLSSLPFMDAIDFQMTAAMNELSMDVYWVEPWMSVQGPSSECVTLYDLGVPCTYSTTQKIPREFDARFANDTEADKLWDMVPAFRSKR